MSISRVEYENIYQNGQPAEARINGVLRGGHVYQGRFYAPAATNIGVLSASTTDVTDLKYHEQETR